jgi:hypothetical protein
MRAFAAVCLLFVALASSVEAVHIHGEWLPHHAAHVEQKAPGSSLPGGEEKCPLCVGMHSALPVTERAAPVTITLVLARSVTMTDRMPEIVWHYAGFSRPPPVVNS